MKNKTIGFLFVFLIFLASSTSSFAFFGVNPTIRVERENEKEDRRASKSAEREERQEDRKEKRASISAEIKEKREEYKLKIKTIRDTKKQERVEKINSKLPEINKKRTDQMIEVLEKLQNALNRIKEKANPTTPAPTAGLRGASQGDLEAKITVAEKAIDDARVAVVTQSEKEYVVTITTENALKITVGQTVSGMQQDLRLTREKVIAARKAVVDAYAALMKLKGENGGTASPSANLNK